MAGKGEPIVKDTRVSLDLEKTDSRRGSQRKTCEGPMANLLFAEERSPDNDEGGMGEEVNHNIKGR